MSALSREIGSRGRADAVVAAEPSAAEPCIAPQEPDALREELNALRLTELRSRAKSAGVSADLLANADDSDDPKQAVVELLLQHQATQHSPDEALREELSSLRLKEIRSQAKQAGASADELEAAADSDDPKAAAIELLLRLRGK